MAKILVVDDDASIVQMVQFLLQRDGHEVLVARDGQEGLETAQQQKPDLIVLDIMMPEMDGFTVTGNLFKDPEMRKIPILIMTAKGNSRDILELVPNVSAYMSKPFDPDDLRQNVKKLLDPTLRIV